MSNAICIPDTPDEPIKFPSQIITQNGATIEPWRDVWRYRDALKDVCLKFSTMPITASLRDQIKYNFIWYAENRSPSYLIRIFEGLRIFFEHQALTTDQITEIRPEYIMNYRATLSRDKEYLLGGIKNFLKRMHLMGLPGVPEATYRLLKKIRLRGNRKGTNVLIMDPEKGPYSEIEFQAISKALDDAYRAAKIALGDFLLAWLFLALGHRPTQYAALRVCDFLISTNSAGHITYSLNIPRAKQRGLKARSLFKTRLIIHNIGEKFVQHIAEVKTIAQSRGADPNNYPLFPALHKDTGAPRGYEWHQTATTLSQYLVVLFKQLKVHSERTGCPLRINPRRFRYSLGTRAAVEGYGLLIIAELLDHTDTQNAGIYIKAVPELIESFTPKLAIQLAPLANAFKGKIIADEKDASQGISPARRIFAAEHSNSMKPAGSCGVHGLCQIMEPLACYTCHAFRPWLHGPHSAILEKLTATREEILNSQNADKRIATINDLTILAVAEVVRQCREIKAQSKDI